MKQIGVLVVIDIVIQIIMLLATPKGFVFGIPVYLQNNLNRKEYNPTMSVS